MQQLRKLRPGIFFVSLALILMMTLGISGNVFAAEGSSTQSETGQAKITSMKASATSFSANGGDREVTVTLNGENLSKINNIKATLRDTSNNDMGVNVEAAYGENPTLKFKMPDNSKRTQATYKLTIDSYSDEENTLAYDGTNAYFTVKGRKPMLSDVTISGQKNVTVVPNLQDESQKFTVRVSGVDLDPQEVEVRAVDENGIVWPVYHYSA